MKQSSLSADAAEKGDYAHYMLKEIHEQPRAIAQTLEERVAGGKQDITANCLVFGGAPVHDSAGDTLRPSAV